jgi:hypothetical protein
MSITRSATVSKKSSKPLHHCEQTSVCRQWKAPTTRCACSHAAQIKGSTCLPSIRGAQVWQSRRSHMSTRLLSFWHALRSAASSGAMPSPPYSVSQALPFESSGGMAMQTGAKHSAIGARCCKAERQLPSCARSFVVCSTLCMSLSVNPARQKMMLVQSNAA